MLVATRRALLAIGSFKASRLAPESGARYSRIRKFGVEAAKCTLTAVASGLNVIGKLLHRVVVFRAYRFFEPEQIVGLERVRQSDGAMWFKNLRVDVDGNVDIGAKQPCPGP